jgi:hypothetical protein
MVWRISPSLTFWSLLLRWRARRADRRPLVGACP